VTDAAKTWQEIEFAAIVGSRTNLLWVLSVFCGKSFLAVEIGKVADLDHPRLAFIDPHLL
jgi:hypothetical protein